jgi:NADH-quinone oxidoreductase subunit A
MVALLFIIFELETVFLMPWATVFRSLGLFGFVGMLIFVGVLLVAFIYAWKKGALQWD